MPCAEAEQALGAIAREAVEQALGAGLAKRASGPRLFRSLRAHPTAVANALLSVHFQLNQDLSQVKPIREDLARLSQTESTNLEFEMLQAVVSSKPPRDVRTATVVELRRAGREALAQILLQGVTPTDKWAAQPAPLLRWGDAEQAA